MKILKHSTGLYPTKKDIRKDARRLLRKTHNGVHVIPELKMKLLESAILRLAMRIEHQEDCAYEEVDPNFECWDLFDTVFMANILNCKDESKLKEVSELDYPEDISLIFDILDEVK